MRLAQVVVSQFDVERSDAGFLGTGCYFSPDAGVSARYCGSASDGTSRVMFVARVAVGRAYQAFDKHPRAERPPPGYDSVVGVASTPERPTPFVGEEVRGVAIHLTPLLWIGGAPLRLTWRSCNRNRRRAPGVRVQRNTAACGVHDRVRTAQRP